MPLNIGSAFLASPTSRYLVAVVSSVLFVGLRLALEPVLEEQAPLIALLAAPILSAWLGGFGPGVVATFMCAAAGQLLFVGPKFTILPPAGSEWLRASIFITYGILFSWLLHVRRQALGELTRKNEELREAEQRVRETLDASPSGMIVVNASGTIELVNGRAERLFGFDRDEMIGMSVEQLVPEAVREEHFGNRERYHAGPTHRPMGRGGVLYARHKDGSVFPAEIGLNPLHGASAGLVLASVLDVSQRHAAEQALQEADRRKDEFIAMLAHELRNPLAPVRHAVEIMKRVAPSQPELQAPRDIIERQVSHMARLVDDLLDVSRISRGQLSLQKERCDLASIGRQVAKDYGSGLEASGLSLVVHERPAPLWVDGDPVRVAQMIGNLLTNAGRFNHQGGSVAISFEADAAAGMAAVHVANTGLGIELGMLARLFNPLEQAAQDLARSKGGLGLGLPLTRGLAELHGGTVKAHSDGPGRGATFSIWIPLAPPPAEEPPSQPEGPVHEPLRILIIEDNQDAAHSLAQLLQLVGHETEVRLDGRSGIEAAQKFSPHLVLSDLGLPGEIDGFGVARALRAMPSLQSMALVALSGYADTAARNRSKEAGFDHHLAKPVDIMELEHLIASTAKQVS
jgi:PAS domain S-box-containing protein